LIPEYLRDFAKIKEKVVFAGVHNRVELWNEDSWSQYKNKVVMEADALAEKLGQVGAF
jgi:MraZ protein